MLELLIMVIVVIICLSLSDLELLIMVIVVIICLSLSDKAEKDKSTYVVKDVDQKLKEKLDKLHNRADNY